MADGENNGRCGICDDSRKFKTRRGTSESVVPCISCAQLDYLVQAGDVTEKPREADMPFPPPRFNGHYARGYVASDLAILKTRRILTKADEERLSAALTGLLPEAEKTYYEMSRSR